MKMKDIELFITILKIKFVAVSFILTALYCGVEKSGLSHKLKVIGSNPISATNTVWFSAL